MKKQFARLASLLLVLATVIGLASAMATTTSASDTNSLIKSLLKNTNKAGLQAILIQLSFDPNAIDMCYLLNDANRVPIFSKTDFKGHNAVLLTDTQARGVYYSFYNKSGDGAMTRKYLTAQQVYDLLNYGLVPNASERYTRSLGRYISDPNQGKKMFDEAERIYNDPPPYNIIGSQCDNIAQRILKAGGKGYTVKMCPNSSFNDLEQLLRKKNSAFRVTVAR